VTAPGAPDGGDETRSRPPADPPRGGEPCLVFVEGDAVLGLRVPLEGEVVLGREPGATVRLPADDVSRRHARIVADGEGHLLVDLRSRNGTWVNGRAVERHRLRAGDRVRVGAFVARYVPAGDPEGIELSTLAAASRTDPLTGLANRRAFEEELGRAVARAGRSGAPLSLVALDVDRFKAVNDGHGHPAGDAVLRELAARARAAARAGDLAARVGGEEFALLLPGAPLAGAVELAERLRAAIAAAPVDVGIARLSVTASLGCATLAPGERPEALLARADARLYEAKRDGRDRVKG
jgi:diguanylate cyclase (GGDEF)-like protein